MKFAIVDIETTGGSNKSRGITEIGIVVTNGTQVLDRWSSLINPFEPIPHRITALTGISDDMVEDAPGFEEVADEVATLLSDCVFVAHNVGFDYAFIRGHFNALGYSWQRPKLCTVRLSRKAFPGLPRYGLGALCDARGISHVDRHRAMGDAEATTELFHQIFDAPRGQTAIAEALKRGTREHWMPQHVKASEFDALPDEPGVYWFLDRQGKPLYIGMSIKLQQRVRSHFSGTTASRKRQTLLRDMHSLKHELSGSEWMAAVMEDVRIRAHWPPLNRAQKQPKSYRTVVHYVDRQGRSRLAIRTQASSRDALRTFHSEATARAWLHAQARDHQLNPEWLGLGAWTESAPVTADAHEIHFNKALESWRNLASGWFVEAGRTPDERGLIAVREGHVRGFGFVEAEDVDGKLDSHEAQGALRGLSEGLHPVAPSSTLDARLREELQTNHTWVEAL
ncbi:MAG: exonuclease domain-containing protein [Bacteroidota bacterium]|nr:exonuclease domain-containing protein [Bacteroidota bacterium]